MSCHTCAEFSSVCPFSSAVSFCVFLCRLSRGRTHFWPRSYGLFHNQFIRSRFLLEPINYHLTEIAKNLIVLIDCKLKSTSNNGFRWFLEVFSKLANMKNCSDWIFIWNRSCVRARIANVDVRRVSLPTSTTKVNFEELKVQGHEKS